MITLQNRFAALRDQHSTGDGVHTQTASQVTFDKVLCKQYFKRIQAHHMQITQHSLDTHTFPSGMFRQVKKLAQFIKPSSPNNVTREEIMHNTENWVYTNMVILEEHYTTVTDNLMEHIHRFRDLE